MKNINNLKIFADRLSDLIAQEKIINNTTLEEIAKKIGVSKASLSKYQNDEAEAGLNALCKISDYFNVSIDYLIGKNDVRRNDIDDIKINNITGLSDISIQVLKKFNTNQIYKGLEKIKIINLLIEDFYEYDFKFDIQVLEDTEVFDKYIYDNHSFLLDEIEIYINTNFDSIHKKILEAILPLLENKCLDIEIVNNIRSLDLGKYSEIIESIANDKLFSSLKEFKKMYIKNTNHEKDAIDLIEFYNKNPQFEENFNKYWDECEKREKKLNDMEIEVDNIWKLYQKGEATSEEYQKIYFEYSELMDQPIEVDFNKHKKEIPGLWGS